MGDGSYQKQAVDAPSLVSQPDAAVSRRDLVRRLGLTGAVAAAGIVVAAAPAAADPLVRTQPRRFRLAPPPVTADTPMSAPVSKGYVDEKLAEMGDNPWTTSGGVMSASGDVEVTGSLEASGLISGLAGGVAYHNSDLRNGQVARDLIVTLPSHNYYSTGTFGTFLCTWSNRAGHSVYILGCQKQYGANATVTLTKLAGNLSASMSYVTRTNDLTIVRLVLGVSNGTHQSSAASFTAQLIGDSSSGRGASVTWEPVDR